jgi:acylphosphatase
VTETRADVRLEATVRGMVQGVGFRWFVVRRASELGLVGWTSNESDGSVRVVAEGPSNALDRLVDYLNKGPSGAQVKSVENTRTPASGEFSSFGIRPGAHSGD